MSDLSTYQQALKRASGTIEQLLGEVDRLKKKEPLAIIGLGCRLPGGANSPEEFWRLLSEGRDAVSPIPAERWPAERYFDQDPEAPGKMYIREGGFLDCSPYDFDPRFFGLSPREAKALDPQHRLLLEVAWESLEHAGIDPASLQGSRTGVFIGISSSDYDNAHLRSGDLSLIDPYSLTGLTFSTAAGRISYTLGLEGPSFPVDTACSSSLVTLHLACRSLRAGECDLALVGGVNLMLTPEPLIAFCKLRALSPDGRCKSFDAGADGYGRGEGCGMIVLKRLDAARRDGDRILALVRGSALNNDGRSNGFTAPNGLAQRKVIGAALEDASLQPGDIDYVEAHGTGTPLGDPVEIEALASALGQGRDAARPLLIGSAKTNIGHLEAAAGVAGIVKLVLSLERERIPPHLHFRKPNPHAPWDRMPLRVASEGAPWPRGARPRRAGISGFGFSGTNAHVILEEAPLCADPRLPDGRSDHLLVLSAADETALRSLAALYAAYLGGPGLPPLAAVCNSAATGRNRFSHGVAVAGAAPDALARRLAAFAARGSAAGLYPRSPQPGAQAGPVFIFTGQGSQYPGMGRELYQSSPVYREALDRCDTLFAPLLGLSVRDLMHGGSEEELSRTVHTQPAIFSLEYSLALLWQSWGVKPSALLGHSIGELVAACVAGILSLEDAVTLVAHRGRLMNALAPGGVMAALFCAEERVLPAIATHAGRVSVAAVNSPETVVVSGEEAAVAALLDALKEQGISYQYLSVSHAFHSHLMEPALDEFERIAASLTFREPATTVISNVTGRPATGDDLRTPSYWRRHLRHAVRFGDSIACLKEQGHDLFLEIGASATLSSFVRRIPGDARCAASLKRGAPAWSVLAAALGELYAAGVAIDWKGYDAPYRAGRVPLPTYPFQRQRHYMNPVREEAARDARPHPSEAADLHPLLGAPLDSPSRQRRFVKTLGLEQEPWLAGHSIAGSVIVPATAYLEMAISAAAAAGPPAAGILLEQVLLQAPLTLSRLPRQLESVHDPEAETFSVYSKGEGASWQLHATLKARALSSPGPLLVPEAPPQAEGTRHEGAAFYREMAEKGYRYGGVFRSIGSLTVGGGEVRGLVEVPREAARGFILHPALLDGCLTLAGALLLYGGDPLPDGTLVVPAALESLHFSGTPATALAVRCIQRERTHLGALYDLFASDPEGRPVLTITGLSMRRIAREQLAAPSPEAAASGLLYRVAWRERPLALSSAPLGGRWLVLATDTPWCRTVCGAISAAGGQFRLVTLSPGNGSPDPSSYEELSRLLQEEGKAAAPLAGVVSLPGDSPVACLNLVRALISARIAPRLYLVTGAAHDPAGAGGEIDPSGAALWGLGAGIAAEAPQLRCSLLDLSPRPDAEEQAALVRELASSDSEDRIALRGGRRYAARLVREDAREDASTPGRSGAPGGAIDPEATYLITGGLGGVGLALARWLAEQGCRHLVLVGRRAPSPEAAAALEDLRGLGADPVALAGDVAQAADVARIVARVRQSMPRLKGIFHAAGVLEDAMLQELDAARLERVLGPKLEGARNLHRATEKDELEHFVLFSSLTALAGSPGQANYAAANAALDGFARWRRSRGLAAVSIQWGPWGEAGMAARDGKSERLAARGVRGIPTAAALRALAAVLRANPVEQCVADLDLGLLAAFVPAAGAGLYAELLAGAEASAHAAGDSRLEALRQALPAKRPALMLQLIRELAAQVVGQSDAAGIEADRPLQEQGFDSLMAVDLRNLIAKTLGAQLPVSLLFDYPTAEKIARFLLDEVLERAEPREQATAAPLEGAAEGKTADELVDEIEQLLA